MAFKTIAPHATSYFWQLRYKNIYTDIDLKTFAMTHLDNAHNDVLHCGEITSLYATSHQTTPKYNACALTRLPPFLSESSLVPCPIQQTTQTLQISFSKSCWWKYKLNHLSSLVLCGCDTKDARFLDTMYYICHDCDTSLSVPFIFFWSEMSNAKRNVAYCC